MPNTLESFISGATRLTALPSSLSRLMLDLNQPDSSTEQIIRAIEADTTLSAKVLKLANSVFYQRLMRASTINVAVVRLGRKTLRSLALAVWTQSVRDETRTDAENTLIAQQLAHGTATAVISRILVQQQNPAAAEDAYIAGLLHDIGRLALFCQMGETYADTVCQRATQERRDILDMEQEILGFDHAMLGARLMESWHIPPICIESAARHHEAELDTQTDPLLSAVAIVDFVATGMGLNVVPYAPRMNRHTLFQHWVNGDPQNFIEQCQQAIASMFGALSEI
jgi:HD-like signal output (HDOD) protein